MVFYRFLPVLPTDSNKTCIISQRIIKTNKTKSKQTNKFKQIMFTANNPKITTPSEEDVDENGARQRVPYAPGPRSYRDATVRGEEVLIFSTSITKGIRPGEFNEYYDGNGKVSFRRFHGGHARHIKEYLGTHLQEVAPKTVIIQSGSNDLPTSRYDPVPVGDIANDIMASGMTCKQYGVQNVIISSVLPRNKWFLQERARDLNKFLSELCKVCGFIFIDNSNILVDQHLYTDGVHLNDEGTIVLANNYLECLNGMHWEKVLGA